MSNRMLSPKQIIALVVIALIAIVLFIIFALSGQAMVAEISAVETLVARPSDTPTLTSTPTDTSTPPPTDTSIPTPTNTIVVTQTATARPTRTFRPTSTPPSPTSTPTSTPDPASIPVNPTATSMYPFYAVPEPVVFTTTNHFLTVMINVTDGNIPLGDYRLVGTNLETGDVQKSDTSCHTLCKASSPEKLWVNRADLDKIDWDCGQGRSQQDSQEGGGRIFDDDGRILGTTPYESFDDENRDIYVIKCRNEIIESNLVFEYPRFETGTWQLKLIDSQGNQASPVFELTLDGEKREWYYYRLAKMY